MAIRFFAVIWVVCFTCPALAQSLHAASKKSLKNYQDAQQRIDAHDYPGAETVLKEGLKDDSGFVEAMQLLGDVYRAQKKYGEATPWYEKVIRLNPPFVNQTRFKLGEALFYQMKYAQARATLEKYVQGGGASPTLEKAQRLMENCHFSEHAVLHPKKFDPINLGPGVNSPFDEYLPSLTVDDSVLLFTRRKLDNEDFFEAHVAGSGSTKAWGKAQPLESSINTREFNEGAGSISADGQFLYLTLCSRPGVMGRCDIYVAKKQGTHWSHPRNVGAPINTDGWEAQPSISADGRTLYFVSNRKGGFGGNDIWVSEMDNNGRWKAPENMGPMVNTAGNEISPFIHPDNQTLYFSSDGFPGLGGADIFFSRKDLSGKWGVAENIGYPINTARDESSLVISADGRKAFFASNSLHGEGGFDLYSFEVYPEARPLRVGYVKGNVYDEKDGKKLGADVDIFRLSDARRIYASSSDPQNGAFLAGVPAGASYAFIITKKGYLLYSENIRFDKAPKDSSGFKKTLNAGLKKISVGGRRILKNIFFESGSYLLRPESKIELSRLIQFMTINPEVSIEISGYTDNVGGDEKNLILSQNRAKAVYYYLVSVGKIAASRFSYKGYGKEIPVATNQTEEGRAANRRTEFKITAIRNN